MLEGRPALALIVRGKLLIKLITGARNVEKILIKIPTGLSSSSPSPSIAPPHQAGGLIKFSLPNIIFVDFSTFSSERKYLCVFWFFPLILNARQTIRLEEFFVKLFSFSSFLYRIQQKVTNTEAE